MSGRPDPIGAATPGGSRLSQRPRTLPRDMRAGNEYHALLVKRHRIMVTTCALIALVGVGCSSPGPTKAAAPTAAAPVALGPSVGEIIHVNREMLYVVLNCAALPSPGEEITVFRGEQPVGRVRVTGPVHDVFAAADIIEGDARQGDRIRR
ncbi:MAG: hypothetical protein V1929_14000 [bacterium]